MILHCLEPDARHRYASASQVAFDLSHGDQVAVGERGKRMHRAGLVTRFRAWFKAKGMEPAQVVQPSAHLASAPIVLAAVATRHGNEFIFRQQRDVVGRLLAGPDHVRLAVVTVIPPGSEVGVDTEEDISTTQRIKHLVLLKHWAEPLQLPLDRISFHVLEGNDAAATLLDYARANAVDHIVTGSAPPGLPLATVWGTFATKLVGEAPCTVTLIRPTAAQLARAVRAEEAAREGARPDDPPPG